MINWSRVSVSGRSSVPSLPGLTGTVKLKDLFRLSLDCLLTYTRHETSRS